jgi:hypothetical protein
VCGSCCGGQFREVSFLHLLSGYCCDSLMVALGGIRRERVRGEWSEYSGYCTKVFETVEEGLLLRVERDERLSERAC